MDCSNKYLVKIYGVVVRVLLMFRCERYNLKTLRNDVNQNKVELLNDHEHVLKCYSKNGRTFRSNRLRLLNVDSLTD